MLLNYEVESIFTFFADENLNKFLEDKGCGFIFYYILRLKNLLLKRKSELILIFRR